MWEFILLAGGALGVGVVAGRKAQARRQAEFQAELEAERNAGRHLCFSAIEALTAALEAHDPYQQGHQERVLHCVARLARLLELPEGEATALRAAAMLHNVGRLGIPESILHKADELTADEQEKLRTHPVLGARILASIPFPWAVAPLVRHQAEYWDGSGYPDGLKGSEIPLGARILAVANAYSALQQPRAYRNAMTPVQALAEIEARAGVQFDPAIVAAFRPIAAEIRADSEAGFYIPEATTPKMPMPARISTQIARAALQDISAAQRETRGLARLTEAITHPQPFDALVQTILECTQEVLPCATYALFLSERGGETLQARAALGVNARHFLGSSARVGQHLTGRAFWRGEILRGDFLPEDVTLRAVGDSWTPMRSTLVVPLCAGTEPIGTLNLYSEHAGAFGTDAVRVLRLVATQAGRALENALRRNDARESGYTDARTGLKNARYLREYFEREINRAQREQGRIAILTLDLCGFKAINDHYGYERGDRTLRELAEAFQGQIRNYDVLTRSIGDEFILALPNCAGQDAEIVAQKLRSATAKYVERQRAQDAAFPELGVRIGVAFFPEDGRTAQEVLQRSDAAMYAEDGQKVVAETPAFLASSSVATNSCPHCNSENIVRNGLTRTGAQRYRCRACAKTFREETKQAA